jgi:hypothetical protein
MAHGIDDLAGPTHAPERIERHEERVLRGTVQRVATTPGATAFTSIFCFASSTARKRVALLMPPLTSVGKVAAINIRGRVSGSIYLRTDIRSIPYSRQPPRSDLLLNPAALSRCSTRGTPRIGQSAPSPRFAS